MSLLVPSTKRYSSIQPSSSTMYLSYKRAKHINWPNLTSHTTVVATVFSFSFFVFSSTLLNHLTTRLESSSTTSADTTSIGFVKMIDCLSWK